MDAAFYRQVLESAPWGAIVAATEVEGPCVYVNPEFTQITGYELDDLPTVADWIRQAYPDPAYRRQILDNWPSDTAPSQMGRDVTYRVTCRDGTTKHIQFRANLLRPGRMVVMLLDVTERRQIEAALRDSEERYRLLVETSPFGIVLHSGLEIDYANPAALRIMGAESAEQVLGRPVLDFVHPDSVPVATRRMAEVRERGIAERPEEQRFIRLDDTIIDVEVHGGLVPHQGQTTVQVTFTDITERKRMERERRRLERRVRQAQRLESLALLAGGVAHDLNNLLVGILGRADLARRPTTSRDEVERHLQALIDTAEGAADLVAQLLAYAGQRKLSVQALDLNEVVTGAEKLLRSTLGQRGELRFELAPDLPPIEGDAVQLRQILLNLVSNAADAMADQPGCICVRTRVVATDDSALVHAYAPREPPRGRQLLLEVQDDGPGMDEPTRERVFDPFFTTKAAGRGLGLAAALGIAQAHGGAITVESRLGQGTAFRIYLPGSRVAVTDRPKRPEALAGQWRGAGTVLVVDDEQLVREVAAVMLSQVGFDVIEASGGQEALALLARGTPVACVLLDLSMPDLGGAETLERIREAHPELPVVLSSGYDEADTAERFRQLAPSAFLAKPYTLDRLVRAMRRALSR